MVEKTVLDELCEKNDYWLSIALLICRDKDLAKDLVQDMYVKLHDTKITDTPYIIRTINNLFLDGLRSNQNKVRLNDTEVKDEINEFEVDDNGRAYLDRYEELPYHQQVFIKEGYDLSFRQLEDKWKHINYAYIYRETKKGLKTILKDDIHLHQNKRMKHHKGS